MHATSATNLNVPAPTSRERAVTLGIIGVPLHALNALYGNIDVGFRNVDSNASRFGHGLHLPCVHVRAS